MKATHKLAALGLTVLCIPAFAARMHGGKFMKMDTDHDGKISESEYTTGNGEMFDQLDKDHDGKLTANEVRVEHLIKSQGMKGPQYRSVTVEDRFKILDADGDGNVSQQESADESRKIFSQLDTDSDGVLNADEMRSAHHKMRREKTRM